jgi:hypothetical protein
VTLTFNKKCGVACIINIQPIPLVKRAALKYSMAKKFPIHPPHPERICWGCDKYCSADSMNCGNGSDRSQHPVELFGHDWLEFGDQNVELAKNLTAPSSDQLPKTLK